ncbi:MAG: tyrosine-type recombinase/integrase, partial [bacterium]|nr:tyrosine-type recombinase/integrase [bacterium]
MSTLRANMLEQMRLHRMAPKTQEAYIGAVKQLATFYRESPDRLTTRQINDYLHHMLVERKLAWSTCNIAIHAFRFFYFKTLQWDQLRLKLPPCKREQKLPKVLSRQEVERLLIASDNPKHRAILMTAYAGGLRVSEVVHLQVTDIDSARMAIRVRQGKGRKDRETLLSPRLLTELRTYWKLQRPRPWLFPGSDSSRPLTITTAQRAYRQAR